MVMEVRFTKVLTTVMMMASMLFVTSCEKIDDWLLGDEDEQIVRVNPEYVPIDWDNATVLSSNDSTGNYKIQFKGTVPDIHPGSVLAIDQDTVVHYIFVESVSINGNTMNITSSEAFLTDIFYDSEFTLSTEAAGKSKASGVVFYPVEAYELDGVGKYYPLFKDGQRKGDMRFTHNLWSFEYNNDGHVLFSGSNYTVQMERMNLDLSLDMEMSMNFGGRTVSEVLGDAVSRYRSKALEVDAALIGTFNTEQRVRCDVWGSCSYTPDYDLWKHNLFRPLSIKFVVYGVPVVLTLRTDLFRQVEMSASGEIAAYTGFTDHAEGRMGFEWKQSGGMAPVGSFENTFTFTPPTVEGKGQIQAKVWAFPRVSVMLYDVVGPSFDFMPYLADTLRGGFREQMLGQTNDYCAWSLDCHTGLDLRCGLSLRFFGYEVENYSTPRWKCIDKKSYHSPKKVVHASGRPQGGQTTTIRFDIYDTSYLTNQAVMTPLPQIVKFEASGELSSEYGIASGGTVSVSWTPNGSDTLWAKLYDIDGNVLAWDTVMVKCDCNLTSGDWVDLGLPSGLLWATRNVGASSSTDYGNYYAWGETTPKSFYDWSTYRYCNGNYDQLTKYCNNSFWGYNGFTDGLTTLQPVDDAATANYGGRTPTKEEWLELANNTTSQWITINGVIGRCFTGSNGNSLFLPAAGGRWCSYLFRAGSYGLYWSSSLLTDFPDGAWYFYFDSGRQSVEYSSGYRRHVGFTVRAVRQN